MKQAVLKLGGSVLRGPRDAAAILDIIDSHEDPLVVVVSAFKGVKDALEAAADREASGISPEALLDSLREKHLAFAEAVGAPSAALEAATMRLDRILYRLSVLLAADCPRDRAEIIGTGERLSATCVALAFAALGRPAPVVEPRELGFVVSEGPLGPFIDLGAAGPTIRAALERLYDSVVPGSYGVDTRGRTVRLGRGGTDYCAAIIAAGLGARRPGARPALALRAGLARKPGVA
jgi:aspartokinase